MKHTAEMTVILPAAGSGQRLGLDYPKELFEIVPGKKLVDFSLDHIQAAMGSVNFRIKLPW